MAADQPLMLMDEPFGAVDPIARDRLQDDFLRLHHEVPKTVVFVTHDIDEAIKMGHRIAILRDGELAQYDTPDNILAEPADDFVADFVGADRGLKRLNVWRIGDLELDPRAGRAGRPDRAPSDTSLRDALSLMLVGGQRAARRRGRGGRSRPAPWRSTSITPPDRPRREGGRAMMLAGASAAPIAQGGPVIPHFERASDCIRENGQFCFSWFVDNFDRRLRAAAGRAHLADPDRGRDRLRDRVHGRAARLHRSTGSRRRSRTLAAFLYTIPSLAFFQLLVPITGLAVTSAEIALVSYTLLILFRNTLTGLREVPEDARWRPGHGPHQGADPAPRRASAGAAGDHGRHPRSRP